MNFLVNVPNIVAIMNARAIDHVAGHVRRVAHEDAVVNEAAIVAVGVRNVTEVGSAVTETKIVIEIAVHETENAAVVTEIAIVVQIVLKLTARMVTEIASGVVVGMSDERAIVNEKMYL